MFKTLLLLSLIVSAAPRQAGDSVHQTIPLQGSSLLRLDAEIGAIQVEPGKSQAVEVEVVFQGTPPTATEFSRMRDDFSLDVSRFGSELRIAGRFKKGWVSKPFFGGFGSCSNMRDGKCLAYSWLKRVEYHVSVPPGLAVDLKTSGGSIGVGDLKGSVTANTSGGSLKLGRIEGPVDAHTSGGSITLTGAAGKAVLSTSGGGITIAETVGEVDATTSGGSIRIDRTTGAVRAHTSGGNVEVREASGAVDASTSGGGIDVALSGSRGYDIDASTSGGRVSSEFPVQAGGKSERDTLRGPVNGGGPLVRLRTSGGSIRIRRAG